MSSPLHRVLFAALAIVLTASAPAQSSTDLRTQILLAVRNGDSAALASLAAGNPAQRMQIAAEAMAAAKAGLAAGARLVLFDSPESEAAAKAMGAVAPAAAANAALASLALAQDFAADSPSEALSLAQAAVEVVADQRVRVSAGGARQGIVEAIRTILANPAVRSAATEGQLAAIEQTLEAALNPRRQAYDAESDSPVTSVDPTLISPS